MSIEIQWIGIGAAFLVGAIGGALVRRKVAATQLAEAKRMADQILSEATKEADILRKEAEIQKKDALLEAKTAWEQEAREMRRELQAQEKRLVQREENLDRKVAQVDARDEEFGQREKRLSQQESRIRSWEKEADALVRQQRERLEELAGLGAEEAKAQLMEQMESEARHECAKKIKQIEDEAKEAADKKAQEILALAVQRYAGDFVAESAVSVVPLPNDEMKGRIIGREGRNIRAIEAATGIDLIIDDTPEAVIISGFNPVRREVARLALERLIGDGRIHPSRIEEAVNKATQDVDNAIREAGEQATFDVGVHGIHPEIIKLIGRLRYRTSYGQNVLQHSIEVAFLCGIMAAELGINVKQAKRAGLLHDIGKAVDHEVEGSHAVIGANLARKYGESAKIVHALAAHHEDEKPSTVLAVLVQAADALSGARPGARREMLETYVKRLQDLERIGTSFAGVTNCYAIQAGREIRVMVSSEEVSDVQSHTLAKQIARQIEEEMAYPGQIKINVIRETRAVEFAK
ncbi:endoribonuclease Y [Syntrophotalea carbinolica DSM 2380]|uniref:Ribonuclease Y n=1 Tax=Syntrophotalea carbinolica (strain DSM 2380 / NBRC 103641 / GraBd1) TaxID=338963 RepID=RNY_SYNC1|nr:ribonuclease Y [Syntrophotalea carbinolica]Q3A218.1 RecName: Full=Ribonuclease Y; Short=RNase Y [Syntrophotalea carbinolica DSM 2380]ABA89589.1 endoribonuclease Y [Syntrophotalea carbinolica DSM 2380]